MVSSYSYCFAVVSVKNVWTVVASRRNLGDLDAINEIK